MRHFLLLIASICMGMNFLCQAAAPGGGVPDITFVNNQTEEFVAFAGQMISRTGLVRFADAEIPPDPNTPVVRSNVGGIVFPDMNDDITSGAYWYSLEGDACFTARIVNMSFNSNQCTVMILYAPRAISSHSAVLHVYCANAGVPVVNIPLRGEATAVLGDMNDDGVIGIGDVTGMVDLLLQGSNAPAIGDVDGNGTFNIGDVTSLINRLLVEE